MKLTLLFIGVGLLLLCISSQTNAFLEHDSSSSEEGENSFTVKAVRVVDRNRHPHGALGPQGPFYVAVEGAYQMSPSGVIVSKELVANYDSKYKDLAIVDEEGNEFPVVYIWHDRHHLNKYPNKAVLFLANTNLLADAFEERIKRLETLLADDDNNDNEESDTRKDTENQESANSDMEKLRRFGQKMRAHFGDDSGDKTNNEEEKPQEAQEETQESSSNDESAEQQRKVALLRFLMRRLQEQQRRQLQKEQQQQQSDE